MGLDIVDLYVSDGLGGLSSDHQDGLGSADPHPGDAGALAFDAGPLRRRHQPVFQDVDDKVLAGRAGVEELVLHHVLDNVLVGEELVADVLDQIGEVLHPVFPVVVHPLDHGLKDDLLREHPELVAGDQFDDVGGRELDEFLRHADLGEVLSGESLGLVKQVGAGVQVGEGHEPEAV